MDQKNTKIICTISDINCEVEFIKQLYLNGMNVARINSAHATLEGARRVVDNIRAVSDKIAILIDTKGPEVVDEQGGHLLTVDVDLRGEGTGTGTGGNAMLGRPLDIGGVPGILRHVRKFGRALILLGIHTCHTA